MIKLLLIGDRHNSESIPSCRIDDFFDSCEKKDNEIIQMAIDNDVDAILQPGDFWTDSDHRLKNDFIAKVSTKWNNIRTSAGKLIPLAGIAGNHDLIGENLGQLNSSTVGLLDALGVFSIVSYEHPLVLTDGNKKVVITGVNYHKGMDKPENISDYIVKEHQGDVHIHIVHGMLSPNNLGKIIRHTRIDNILETKADITFCGHDHNGFGAIKADDKYFINPGAVVRLSANEKELNRTIQVALVTIDDEIKVELIPLKSALPGKSVIDRTQLDKAAEIATYTEVLKDTVKHLDIGKSVGMVDILEEIYTEQNIPEELRKSISKDIQENTDSIRKVAKTAIPHNYITKIHLINFQSHSDTTMELSKNFNIVVGESRQGKSAIMRALRWLIENKPSGKSFMKIGEDNVSVEITLSDGTIIKRFIAGRENGYKVYFPDGKIEEGNTKMVTRIQEILGYCNLKIDENMSIPLNILRQGNDWYLIGENYSATDRARILGSLKNTNAADASIKGYEKENNQLSSSIKKEEIEVSNLNLEIDTLAEALAEKEALAKAITARLTIQKVEALDILKTDLDEKSKLVNRINNAFDEASLREKITQLLALCEKLRKIRKYLEISSTASAEVKDSDKLLYQLPDIDALLRLRSKLEEQIKSYSKLVELQRRVSVESANIKRLDSILGRLNALDEKSISALKDMVNKYVSVKLHYTAVVKGTRTIAAAERFISASEAVLSYSERKQNLLALCDKHSKVSAHLAKIADNRKILNQKDSDLKKADEALEAGLDKKIHILSEAKVCPTCLSELTASRVTEIVPRIKEALK